MLPFKIFYDDHTTYAGEPFAAPAWGVLCIVEMDPEHGRRIAQGRDFYVWEERGDGAAHWWEADQFGLMDYLARPGPRKVLIGRMVPNSVWARVFARAEADPDFQARTGWGVYETRRKE